MQKLNITKTHKEPNKSQQKLKRILKNWKKKRNSIINYCNFFFYKFILTTYIINKINDILVVSMYIYFDIVWLYLGRWDPNDPNPKRWKANFRCALNSLQNVMEIKKLGESRGVHAFRVYQFLDEEETKPKEGSYKIDMKIVYNVLKFNLLGGWGVFLTIK